MKAKILKNERYSTGLNLNLIIYDVPEVLDNVAKLSGEVEVTIKGLKHKRSKDANAYFWEIVGQMADKLGATKEEIYFEQLKKYGQSITVTVQESVDLSRAGFKYFERIQDGVRNGVKFVAYRVFIGSSQYNTKEMSVLIDGTVQDAKDLGIQTELFFIPEPDANPAKRATR
jgi:S-adenosylmethionine/arginine decarboxylase-like enzyme